MSDITRVILGNIPPFLSLLMYAASGLSALVLVWGVRRHLRIWRWGLPEDRFDRLWTRLADVLTYALGQRRLLANPYRGAMHLLLFGGFMALLLATILTGVQHDLGAEFLHGRFYLVFSFLSDLFGLALIVGVAMAAWNRYVRRPGGLTTDRDDVFVLSLLLAVAVTGFLLEGARLAGPAPAWEVWSFVGYGVGRAFTALHAPAETWLVTHRALWALHVAVSIAFFVSIPFTKLFHMFTSPLNIFFRSHRPSGYLRPEEVVDGTRPVGARAPSDLTWKQLLDLSACTRCGRCQDVCPAWGSGKPLSPRKVILGLREGIFSSGRPAEADLGALVSPEELWSCTTCGACTHSCPVFVEHVDKIVALRRRRVDDGVLPDSTARALEGMLLFGNPSQVPQSERADWARGLGIGAATGEAAGEYLYWVGCAGAYDPQGQSIAAAVVGILKAARVSFTMLGDREKCCGEPARRLGEEGLYQRLAGENIAALESAGARTILTHCPHCYNVLKHEYPDLGGRFDVVHHTELIAQLIASGRLALQEGWAQRITYHDPCYLGRHNGICEAPRGVLRALPAVELVEMRQSRTDSFCCGGGGGQMWTEMDLGRRINYIRFEQARALTPSTVATACPYCKTMLDVAATYYGVGQEVRVRDIAEILRDALQA